MKTNTITIALATALSLAGCVSQYSKSEATQISWDNSLILPPADGSTPNIGVAGAFAGIVNNKLIVIGGANFPDGYPWTGASKVWHNDAYCLDLTTGEWTVIPDLIQQPLAYGISIQLNDGVLMIGGGNSQEISSAVNLLTEHDGTLLIDSISYPSLPHPLVNATGAMTDNKIFLAGGVTDITDERASSTFIMLDLDKPELGWQQLRTWPGPPLGFSTSAGVNGKFYLFSGRNFAPGQEPVMYTDGYCYDPASASWTRLDNWFPVVAGRTITRNGDVLFLGGVEELLPTSPEHPGFSNLVRRYNIASNKIDTVSISPYPLAVTTTTVFTGDTLYITSGEERPGIRTPHILRGLINDR